jgi:BclB C-terminal domain-containing protein
LTTIAGGLVGTTSLVGFGGSVAGVSILGGSINTALLPFEYSFTVPQAGTITAMSATFKTTAALTLLLSTVTITAQVYRAVAGSNVFTPTTAVLTLAPSLTGLILIGNLSFASSSSISVPVAQGDRLLMVFSASASGISLVNTVIGGASAGLTISL